MQIAIPVFSIVLLLAVFELGHMISERSGEWSMSLNPDSGSSEALRKSFWFSGKIIQVMAVAWTVVNIMTIVHALPHM